MSAFLSSCHSYASPQPDYCIEHDGYVFPDGAYIGCQATITNPFGHTYQLTVDEDQSVTVAIIPWRPSQHSYFDWISDSFPARGRHTYLCRLTVDGRLFARRTFQSSP